MSMHIVCMCETAPSWARIKEASARFVLAVVAAKCTWTPPAKTCRVAARQQGSVAGRQADRQVATCLVKQGLVADADFVLLPPTEARN